MSDQEDRWHALASRLGFKVTAPVMVQLGDEEVAFAALLPQFGGRRGLIADPDWEIISRHRSSLVDLGYGYSTVSLGGDTSDESAKAMLRDWGWSAFETQPSWW